MLPRVTPRRALPDELAAIELDPYRRARVHMIASLLLDYPDEAWFARLPRLQAELRDLPAPIVEPLEDFMDAAAAAGVTEWQRRYVMTFDLKRKCSLYLSYYATGDTRKRGTALVTFLEAYRAAGWEFDARELPDFLPVVLEFSALSDSPIAAALIASHRDGIEVLRAALEAMDSPWAAAVRAVTLSLPPIDDETRERFVRLVTEGPPAETVGLSFLGSLPPFQSLSQRGVAS
ncbi:nitrate reductase molybdenum cofactor assembly chaperone [Microbacterium sp. B2969]|uniref:Nitrate reductase molybdenum cofactor assembly chaperone n=1 Tax=Microbacterium alkaliflavum TaxID=3248839 RepID=A0ABW7Q4J2_9MICO